MMGVFKWAEGRVKRFDIWDFAMLKVALVILGMVIGAYIASFVRHYVWVFVVVFVVLYALLMFKAFKK